MPESGTSTLHRLFPWPVTIVFYSPDPQYRVRLTNESTNHWERWCALKLLRIVSLTFHLHTLLGNRIILRSTEVSQGVPLGRIRPQNAFWDA